MRITTVRVRVRLPVRVVLVGVLGTRPVVVVPRALQTVRQGVPLRVQGARGAVQVGVLTCAQALVLAGAQHRVPVAVPAVAQRVQDDRR